MLAILFTMKVLSGRFTEFEGLPFGGGGGYHTGGNESNKNRERRKIEEKAHFTVKVPHHWCVTLQ